MQTAHQPKQRTRCEVWTRVMGYHRPLSHFNIGKKSEHISRKHFTECRAANAYFIERYPAEDPTLNYETSHQLSFRPKRRRSEVEKSLDFRGQGIPRLVRRGGLARNDKTVSFVIQSYAC